MVARQRNAFVSTSDAVLRVPTQNKSNQAWKYPKHQVVRAPNVHLNGRAYYDHINTDMPRRRQESNLFITINTNKMCEPGEEHDMGVKAFEEVLKELAKESVIAKYIKFGPVTPSYRNDRFQDVIIDTSFMANVEIGPTVSRLHAHIWITVHHYSQVQIEPKLLKTLFKKMYNARVSIPKLRISTQPHVYVKVLPQSNWADIVKDYIHKGMTSMS